MQGSAVNSEKRRGYDVPVDLLG